jgi:hypothetical protein
MYLMQYVAILSGVFVGWYTFRHVTNVMITVLLFVPYRSKYRFDAIYEAIANKQQYNIYGRKDSITYGEYLRLHEASKEQAYKLFLRFYREPVKLVFFQLAPYSLLPVIIFWSNWHMYVIGIFISVILLALHSILVKNYSIGILQRSMLFTVLDAYINKTTKRS